MDNTEIVIVGGGIIGCSLASELARSGRKIVLLERREIASGPSGRNHGLIFHPASTLTDPLQGVSVEMYRELAERSMVDFALDASPVGTLIAVRHDREWPLAEVEARAVEQAGVEVSKLTGAQCRELEPNLSADCIGGWFMDDARRCDPASLTLAFALEARALGADIRTFVDVKQLTMSGSRVTGVATDAGLISADLVVAAAGVATSKLLRPLGVDVGVIGARGWLMLTSSVSPLVTRIIESPGWHLIADDSGMASPNVSNFSEHGEGDITHGTLIQQNKSGHILLGSSRRVALTSESADHDIARRISAEACATVPALKEIPVEAVWSGVRPMSRRGIPTMGFAPVPGLFISTGHGGQGVILGGGSARLCSQLINGEQTFMDPSPFQMDSFESTFPPSGGGALGVSHPVD